jgi:hypothetical protein
MPLKLATAGVATLATLFLLHAGIGSETEEPLKQVPKKKTRTYKPKLRRSTLADEIIKPTPEWFSIASSEEIKAHYLNCFTDSDQQLRNQGEDFQTSEQRLRLCEDRLDAYLTNLRNKGMTQFLKETNVFSKHLAAPNLIQGLERLGGEFAVYSLLHMNNFSGLESDAENLDVAKRLIYQDHLSTNEALNFYIPVFFAKPTKRGLEFIADLSNSEERLDFLQSMLFSYDSKLTELVLNSNITLPKEMLEQFFGKTESKYQKMKALTKTQTEEATERMVDIYRDATPNERYVMIAHLGTQPKTPLNRAFLETNFMLADNYLEILMLGDTLGPHIGYLTCDFGSNHLDNLSIYIYEQALSHGELRGYKHPIVAPQIDVDSGLVMEEFGACRIGVDNLELFCFVGDEWQ